MAQSENDNDNDNEKDEELLDFEGSDYEYDDDDEALELNDDNGGDNNGIEEASFLEDKREIQEKEELVGNVASPSSPLRVSADAADEEAAFQGRSGASVNDHKHRRGSKLRSCSATDLEGDGKLPKKHRKMDLEEGELVVDHPTSDGQEIEAELKVDLHEEEELERKRRKDRFAAERRMQDSDGFKDFDPNENYKAAFRHHPNRERLINYLRGLPTEAGQLSDMHTTGIGFSSLTPGIIGPGRSVLPFALASAMSFRGRGFSGGVGGMASRSRPNEHFMRSQHGFDAFGNRPQVPLPLPRFQGSHWLDHVNSFARGPRPNFLMPRLVGPPRNGGFMHFRGLSPRGVLGRQTWEDFEMESNMGGRDFHHQGQIHGFHSGPSEMVASETFNLWTNNLPGVLEKGEDDAEFVRACKSEHQTAGAADTRSKSSPINTNALPGITSGSNIINVLQPVKKSRILSIAGLPDSTPMSTIMEAFKKQGKIMDCKKDEKGGMFTLCFSTESEAVSAKRHLHRSMLAGKQITVDYLY